MNNIITNIPNNIGIIYISDTKFQIREIMLVKAAKVICIFLSSPKYLGANPTEIINITDIKGKN
jgi:hypothetical protein